MQWNNWWNVTHTNVAYSYTVFLLQILCNLLNFRSNLTWCLHPLMNSFLLFNNPLSFYLIIRSMRCPFSGEHSGQKLIFVLPYTFSAIVYLTIDIVWSSFNDHYIFWQFCAFLHCSCLKSMLRFPTRALKDVSARPNYILFPLFALFSTSAQYIRSGIRHWFSNWQLSLFDSCNHTR